MGTLLQRRFGISVCETTLQRVMSRHNLGARIRQVRKAKPHAGRACKQDLPDNLLNRRFQADKPLHRLVTDVTYVPYFENGQWHWGCLSLVQDLYDRSIVARIYSKKIGHTTGSTNAADSVLPTTGTGSYAPQRPRLHLYGRYFRDLVSRMGLTHSFSQTGNCHDNVTMECFNRTFKVITSY